MGCISSKFLVAADLDTDLSTRHVVSLTSTTYGALNLDRNSPRDDDEKPPQIPTSNKVFPCPSPFTPQSSSSKKRVVNDEPREIINTWELMKDLTHEETPIWSPAMKPPTLQAPISTNSPKNQRRGLVIDKENVSPKAAQYPKPSPNRVLRPLVASNRQPSKLAIEVKNNPRLVQKDDWDNAGSGRRRSLSPLFDSKPRDILDKYEKKCPNGGENALILYSTTLRGIRKTFEDCNKVRSAIEGHDVKVIERDISMDSGFREELRELMGKKEVRPPLLFVKGRLIGGVEEVVRLEEEGELGLLLAGIAKKAAAGCCGVCGGMRFVMCRECNGSCKVLEGKEMVKCGECNENGLIHCQLCC